MLQERSHAREADTALAGSRTEPESQLTDEQWFLIADLFQNPTPSPQGGRPREEMFGPGIDAALKGLAATSPDLVRCLVEFPFGDIYPRPGLDLKTREMLTVAALTVLGFPQGELKEHICGALKVGCTRDQILEIILQMAVYAGFPAAIEAVKTAALAFDES